MSIATAMAAAMAAAMGKPLLLVIFSSCIYKCHPASIFSLGLHMQRIPGQKANKSRSGPFIPADFSLLLSHFRRSRTGAGLPCVSYRPAPAKRRLCLGDSSDSASYVTGCEGPFNSTDSWPFVSSMAYSTVDSSKLPPARSCSIRSFRVYLAALRIAPAPHPLIPSVRACRTRHSGSPRTSASKTPSSAV